MTNDRKGLAEVLELKTPSEATALLKIIQAAKRALTFEDLYSFEGRVQEIETRMYERISNFAVEGDPSKQGLKRPTL